MMRRFARRLGPALAVIVVLGHTAPAFAYLKLGFLAGGRQVTLRWKDTPIRYFVNDAGVPGVSSGDLQAAAARAFATWEAVPTATVSYTFAGYTAARAGEDDGRSTIGFRSEPGMDRVLAQTSFVVDIVTGELVESDIFFNSAFAWSVTTNGEPNRWDLESIAVHEIGHFSGLGHSAIGETELLGSGGRRVLSTGAVMFPIALGAGDISGRTLDPDDVAGISDLYPASDFDRTTGSVSGRVTREGRGLFGAHVVAFDPERGEMVANFTLNASGQFSIAGLRPGPHIIRVEPLDDADIESFVDGTIPVDIDFRVTYFDRLVVVPRGGDSGAVEIRVQGK